MCVCVSIYIYICLFTHSVLVAISIIQSVNNHYPIYTPSAKINFTFIYVFVKCPCSGLSKILTFYVKLLRTDVHLNYI